MIVKRIASVFFMAYMLGISNVILEETRMVNDSATPIELQEEQPEESD